MNYLGRRGLATAALALLVVGQAIGQVSAGQPSLSVSVSVIETAGVARRDSPVTVGVPLPSHAPAELDAFRLLADDGSEIATDRWAIARWHGAPADTARPIRWLGVSFVADSAPHEIRTVTLVADTSARLDARLLGRQLEDGIHLATGALSFRLPHTGTSLLDNLWIDLDGRPGVDAEMIPADHSGGLLVANTSQTPPRWRSAGARIVRNGHQTAVASVDLISDTPGLGAAVLWAEVGVNMSWVKLTLEVGPADGSRAASPVSVVLPIRTLGDPLQLGVRRGLDGEVLEGPLAANDTLFVEPGEHDWDGTLGSLRAEGLLPWAQMSTPMWSTAVAVDLTSPQRGLRVSGNGTLSFDLAADPDSGTTAARLFLESRRRSAPAERVVDFDRPLVAVLSTEWYRQTRVLGPLPIPTASGLSARSGGGRDPAVEELLRFVATGETEWLARAGAIVRRQLAAPAGGGLRGPALYAWISGDPVALAKVGDQVLAAGASEPSGWQAFDAIVAWEVTGDPRFLDRARASLRAGVEAAWAADACISAAQDAAGVAALMQATAQYVWTLREQERTDQAAENALFGMLDRLGTCPPEHASWADTWSYGALLATDAARRERWARLAGTAAGPRRGQ